MLISLKTFSSPSDCAGRFPCFSALFISLPDFRHIHTPTVPDYRRRTKKQRSRQDKAKIERFSGFFGTGLGRASVISIESIWGEKWGEMQHFQDLVKQKPKDRIDKLFKNPFEPAPIWTLRKGGRRQRLI